MFNFYRDWRTGPVEVWKILLTEDIAAGTEERFGPAVMSRAGDDVRYHNLGFVVAIPAVANGKQTVKYFMAWKDGLTDEEIMMLHRERELLIGKRLHASGTEEERGWFWYDELQDFV